MSLIKKGPSPALTLAHPANSRHSPGRAASGAKKSPGEETSALALACTPAAVEEWRRGARAQTRKTDDFHR